MGTPSQGKRGEPTFLFAPRRGIGDRQLRLLSRAVPLGQSFSERAGAGVGGPCPVDQ
jgi:hypothetical protein